MTAPSSYSATGRDDPEFARHLRAGEVVAIGDKLYQECRDCGGIIQINKPAVGSAHLCEDEMTSSIPPNPGVPTRHSARRPGVPRRRRSIPRVPPWLALTGFGIAVVNLDQAHDSWHELVTVVCMALLARRVLPTDSKGSSL